MTKDWSQLVYQFRSRTLFKSEWTHEAHLVVSLWYLLEYNNIHSTLCHLRAGVILYNNSVGIKNTESSGYHETVTVFWVKQIEGFLEGQSSRDFGVLVEKLLHETPLTKKDYILEFYDKEKLKSVEARSLYVAHILD